MKKYPSVLPAATRIPCAQLERENAVKEVIVLSIETLLTFGFWSCKDCDGVCEREEGEQGQPAHCLLCCSHRIEWNPPIDQIVPTEPTTNVTSV